MRVPSGDHTGLVPLVRKRLREPSAFTIQSAVSQRSLMRSTQRRVYTTRCPSGEICGSLTVS